VPDSVGVVTLDVSYLALGAAMPQLGRVRLEPACGAIALVKPQFELGLARPPTDVDVLRQAVDRATHGFGEAGWDVKEAMASPVPGARGAVEFLLHAVRGIRRDRP
jgi:predicted rRNA methylase YqxC with S4 and FtsJ domains